MLSRHLVFLILLFLFMYVGSSKAQVSCNDVPLTDRDYVTRLAEKGDANAQYLLGIFLDDPSQSHTFNEEANKWFTKAAEQGHVMAQESLCHRFYSLFDRLVAKQSDIQWCYKAAAHGQKSAAGILGELYMKGKGVPQDDKMSYYWFVVMGNPTGNIRKVEERLAPDVAAQIYVEAKQFRPLKPTAEKSHFGHWQEQNELLSLDGIPVSVAGLICGGQSRGCQIQNRCGNLAAILCPRGVSPKYIIANSNTTQIVSSCTEECSSLLPKEWSCPSPENMPPDGAEIDKYSHLGPDIVSCGEILGVTDISRNFSYKFFDRTSGEQLAECFSWTTCKLPHEWKCGYPSNFH